MPRHGKYDNSVNPRGHGHWYLKVNLHQFICFVFFFFFNKLCNQKLLTTALVLGLA